MYLLKEHLSIKLKHLSILNKYNDCVISQLAAKIEINFHLDFQTSYCIVLPGNLVLFEKAKVRKSGVS